MPRPKVAPQDRQRASRACLKCRSSKKRCNGQQPCFNCIRKGRARACVFTDSAASTRSPGNGPPTSRASISSHNEAGVATEPDATLSPSRASLDLHTSPEASHRTHSRLLNSLRGGKVFVGQSASLAFLQLMREVVSQSLGNSNFSQSTERDYMLEGPQYAVQPISALPLGLEKRREYVDLAYTASQGLVEFWDKNWVMTTISPMRATSDCRSDLELAVAHTIVAIGAQCVADDENSSLIARSYFADAQECAFAARLQISNLETVQAFLLMTFYLMSACQRNVAYVYLGIAAQTAFVLGLHSGGDASDTDAEDDSDNRDLTWRSLVTLDVMVSSILGRPSATSTRPLGENLLFQAESQPSVHSALHANFRLACLLDQKVQNLYLTENVTTQSARACLDSLGRWSASIPKDIRRIPASTLDYDSLNKAVGGLHVSCAYYFGVMLVSRPFLILHLTSRLTQHLPKPQAQSGSGSATECEDLAEIEEIAIACINAAMYMIQTCSDMQSRGMFLRDMRIVKAWAFAAGLVLGFEMFTTLQSEAEVEKAFHGSRDVLQMLSDKSIQAAHYFDILTSLSDAIAARRRQMSKKNKRSGKPIVEKIMAFGNQQGAQDDQISGNVTNARPISVDSTSVDNLYDPAWPQDLAVDLDFQALMNEPILNWGSTDFMTWG